MSVLCFHPFVLCFASVCTCCDFRLCVVSLIFILCFTYLFCVLHICVVFCMSVLCFVLVGHRRLQKFRTPKAVHDQLNGSFPQY